MTKAGYKQNQIIEMETQDQHESSNPNTVTAERNRLGNNDMVLIGKHVKKRTSKQREKKNGRRERRKNRTKE